MNTPRIIRRALVTVTNKDSLGILAALPNFDYEILSTGGTGKRLQELGIPFIEVSEYTGMPEMMDGRLKTLHPRLFGGILADRKKPSHMEDAGHHSFLPIDLMICNLYEFEKRQSIEEIDIGGPSLIRAAAKNHASVTVIVDPSDYQRLIDQMRTGSLMDNHNDPFIPLTSGAFRFEMAHKAFAYTAQYDTMIATWFGEQALAGVGGGKVSEGHSATDTSSTN